MLKKGGEDEAEQKPTGKIPVKICTEFRYAKKKEKKRMKKKGRKLLLSLLAAAGILVGSGQVVQAAENVIGIQ